MRVSRQREVVELESGDSPLDVRQIDLRLHERGELLAGRTLKVPELQDRDRRVGIPTLNARRQLDQRPDVLTDLRDRDRSRRGTARAAPAGRPPKGANCDHGSHTQNPIERLEISAFLLGHHSLHCSMYGQGMPPLGVTCRAGSSKMSPKPPRCNRGPDQQDQGPAAAPS